MTAHPVCDSLRDRGLQRLAGGPATLSKHWQRYSASGPKCLVRGDGAYVWCADNEQYIDCVAGLGPVILGHSDPAVNLAIYDQVDKMMCSTLTTPLEAEVAEMLCAIIPGAEGVRFACNGKDVNEAAVKLARYFTGKDHVIYVGYAGGFSDYLVTTDKCGGILPELQEYNHQVPWRDFQAIDVVMEHLEIHLEPGNLAAIVLEVPPEYAYVTTQDTATAINMYKKIAHRYGGLFILDEVVTGLRYAMGGAQEYYGVTGDLITMSKALGNGMPIAALLGPHALLEPLTDGKVFLSTTFGGHPVGLAAAKANLDNLQSKTYGRARIEEWGTAVHTQLCKNTEMYSLPVRVKGNFARMVLEWREVPGVATVAELQTLWLQETVKRGVVFGVPIFPMCAYNEDVVREIEDATCAAMAVIRDVLQQGCMVDALEVPVIGSVFNRYEQDVRT